MRSFVTVKGEQGARPMRSMEYLRTVLCEVTGEPIEQLAELIGAPIKLTGKRALRKALAADLTHAAP
jgi:hypothetical protein